MAMVYTKKATGGFTGRHFRQMQREMLKIISLTRLALMGMLAVETRTLTMSMHTKKTHIRTREAASKLEDFIIGILFVALIVTIVEKTLHPWDGLDDEPPKQIYQGTACWIRPIAVTGTVSPYPGPVDFSS